MTDEVSGSGKRTAGDSPRRPSLQESEEAKRRAARRRFLLGGAAAVPILFTVKGSHAAETWTECAERIGWNSFLVPGLRKTRGSFVGTFPPCAEETFIEMQNEMDSSQ